MTVINADWIERSKFVVFPLLLAPLFLGVWTGAGAGLGPDPAKAFVDLNGLWAFRFLLLSLMMTPLRYLTGQSFWIRYRRMLGLSAFFYASIHVLSYIFLLFGGKWAEISVELVKRPYIIVGGFAYLLLLPLALTSTRGWQKRLGRRWVRLHQLVYAVAALALIHFAWVKKTGFYEIWPYALALVLLLGIRIWKRFASPSSRI